jgi:hypothetical protein
VGSIPAGAGSVLVEVVAAGKTEVDGGGCVPGIARVGVDAR